MGRLRKSKVDEIVKLRKQDYTQIETAEKVGVHLKTVQKYDPLRRPKKALGTGATTSQSIERLQSQLKSLGDWVWSIRHSLLVLGKQLHCSACGDPLYLIRGSDLWVCEGCGHRMPLPSNVGAESEEAEED